MNKQTGALRASRSHPLVRQWLITSVAAAALAACGGGGGGGSSTPTPQPISGTAAAGAPVVGTVTVKDSTGASKTSTIAADGSYSVNVAGMTGPFVFMADGTVGGRTIQMVSAATSADINKTINITPFTDLIVANVAGQLATTYFASPTFSLLTATELEAARQTLTTRLLPILEALGVAASFDLLRSSFAADHSGFDAVMDVVRVSTDAATQTATITDLVNNQQIQDNLASKADATVIAAPSASLTDTVASLKGIEDTLSKFSAVFATGLPASDNAALRALMSSDFLDWGGGVDGFLSSAGVLVARMVGVKQSGVSIVSVSDNGATLDVRFQSVHRTADFRGDTTNLWEQQFRRNAQGTWQYAGNRRWLYTETTAQHARFPTSDNRWDYAPNIAFWAETRNPKAAYALLTGAGIKSWSPASFPGTAPAGMVLGRTGNAFKMPTTVGARLEGTWLPDCARNDTYWVGCFDLSGVLAGAVYTFTMLDAKGVAIGSPATATLAARPNTAAEMTAAGDAWFPRLASSDPATKAGLVDGKRITFTLTPPTDSNYKLWMASLGTPSTYQDGLVVGTGVDIGVWSGAAPTEATAVTYSRDATTTRRFATFQPIN
jgi:hypothetical protein